MERKIVEWTLLILVNFLHDLED